MAGRFAIVSAGVVLLAWLWGIGGAAAQQQPAQQPPNMPDMAKMHEQMMAQMKADRTTLDALVKEMNAASGNRKVDATAAAVTELVRQHNAMFDRMGQMHEHMMTMMMGGRGMMQQHMPARGQ